MDQAIRGASLSESISEQEGLLADNVQRREWLALGLACVAGCVLRTILLDAESLWYDEVVSHTLAQSPVGDLLSGRVHDRGNPAAYFALLSAWRSVFGDSGASLRMLSALLGALAIPATWLLARALGLSSWGRGAAAWLVALSPPLIFLSREARAFSAEATVLVVVGWLAERVWRRGRWFDWVGFTASSVLLIHLHYYSFFFLGVLGFYLLYRERKQAAGLAKLAGAAAVIALSFVHWLPTFMTQLAQGGTRSDETWLLHLIFFPAFALVGHTLAWKAEGPRALVLVELLILVAVYLPALVLIVRSRRWPPLPLWFVTGVLAVVALYSVAKGPIVTSRYLCPIIPFVLVLIASAASAAQGQRARRSQHARSLGLMAAVVLLATTASLAKLYLVRQKEDWRGLVAHVDQAGDHRTVYFFEDHGSEPFRHYDAAATHPRVRIIAADPAACPADGVCLEPGDFAGVPEQPLHRGRALLQRMSTHRDGFWMIYYLSGSTSRDQGQALRSLIATRFAVASERCFPQMCAALYR